MRAKKEVVWNLWYWPRGRIILGVLLFVAAILRVIYFVQIQQSPLIVQHHWEQSDMNFFDTWAKQIVSGDLLTDQSLHPLHGWHQKIANEYFQNNPGKYELLQQASPDLVPAKALWNHWYGEKILHQEPLYSYLIALTYKIFSPDVRFVFAWQMLLGLSCVFLMYSITKRYFGEFTGLIAAFLGTVFAPSLYGEMTLLREPLITFFSLLLIELLDRVRERPSKLRWFGMGLIGGLAILTKSTFLIFFVIFFGLTIWNHFYGSKKEKIGSMFGFLILGLSAALSPLVLRNLCVGVPLFSMSSVGAITFIHNNAVDVLPQRGALLSSLATAIMTKTDGRLLPTVMATLDTHPNIGSFLALLWDKFTVMWNWYEIPDNANFYYYQLHAPILNYLLTFSVIGPLNIFGLGFVFLKKRQIRNCSSLLNLAAVHMVSLLGFAVVAKYRVSLEMVLIPLAAFGLSSIFELVLKKHYAKVALSLATILMIAFWTLRPLQSPLTIIRPADYIVAHQYYYIPRLQDPISRKDWATVAALIRQSLSTEPNEVRTLSKKGV